MAKITQKHLWLMLVVLLLASATFTLGATSAPVWTDEGSTAWVAAMSDPGMIWDTMAGNNHPPLYFIFLSGWRTLAGDSHISLRFVSIAVALVIAALVYRLGRRVFGNPAATYAALLFVVSDLVIEYSQQIRHYTLLALAVCLTSLLFINYVRRPRARSLTGYMLSVIFAAYGHYQAIIWVGLQALVALLVWRGPARAKLRLVMGYALAVLAYTPWTIGIAQILYLLTFRGLAGRPGITTTVSPEIIGEMLGFLFDGQALLIAVALAAAWRIMRRPDRLLEGLPQTYIMLAGVGIFTAMLVINPVINILAPRTLMPLTPFIVIVSGYGLTLIAPGLRHLLLAVTIALSLITTTVVQPRFNNDRAAEVVAADYQPGDLVVIETGFDDNAFWYELTQVLPNAATGDLLRTLPYANRLPELEYVLVNTRETVETYDRVWVVQWLQIPQVLPYLDGPASGYERVLTHELPIGEQYEDLFDAPIITVVLFERVGG